MVPYPRARYVIYVKVERPIGSYYGSVVAAPAFAEIARAAMLHAGVLPSGRAQWRLNGGSRWRPYCTFAVGARPWRYAAEHYGRS